MPINLPKAPPIRTWAIRQEGFQVEIAAIVWEPHDSDFPVYIEFYGEDGLVVAAVEAGSLMNAYWRSAALGLSSNGGHFCEPGNKAIWHSLPRNVAESLERQARIALEEVLHD